MGLSFSSIRKELGRAGQQVIDIHKDVVEGIGDAHVIGADIISGGAISQRRAVKAQQAATRAQERIAAVQNARARRKAVAAARRESATATAAAASSGALGSSGIQGFQSGATSALGSNLSFQQGLASLENQRLSFLSRAAGFEGDAALAQGVGQAIKTAVSFA